MSAGEEGSLPAGCRLVPIAPGEPSPLQMCAVVQQSGQKETPPTLILLGSSWLGRAYLGALADAKNRVHSWLEIWVQATADGANLTADEPQTNLEFDARWRQWSSALAGDPALIDTGWEATHPRPVWFDLRNERAVVPRDPASGEAFELCTDEAALNVAGLDSFDGTRRRFLAVRGQPAAGFLAPVGEVPAGARPAADALPGGGADLLPFNPEGGYLLIRRLAPLEWEAYAGLLSGRTFRGLSAGRPPVKLGGPYASLDDWDRLQQTGASLLLRSRGLAGRFHETFHLKLLLLQSMLREVRELVKATQLPLLDLGPDSFRVELSSVPGALAVLWTARAVLTSPPTSVALVAPGDLRYFKPAAGLGRSIYRPEATGRGIRGRGELRVRKVNVSGPRVQVEATVASREMEGASPRDLVWARLPLPGTAGLDLAGGIDAAEALAKGEARFRTAPLDVGSAVLAALPKTEGGVFPGTLFELIPLLSTPVDLYALGVLGVQLFLTGNAKALPVALDELLSLVRAAEPGDDQARLEDRFRELAATDPRWMQSLGPQNHGHAAAGTEEATSLLPAELWWDLLATLARFFPGTGSRAFCRDLGDAPPYQLESAFDAPLAAVEALVLRSQSLLLCDWPSNREIARLIQKLR